MARGIEARLAAVLALILASCASPSPILQRAPTPEQRAAARAAGFEVSPELRADDLLAPEVVSGPHHHVHPDVFVDNLAHHYWIESDFGAFDAWGDDALDTRLREIEALVALSQMSKTAEFTNAAAEALKSPFVATWNLITSPVDTIVGVPVAAWEKVRQTSQLARRERGELEDSGFSELIGFEVRKRRIAGELGVDPYTSNKALQTQLNRFAWAAYAGGLPVLFVPFVRDEASDPDADRLDELMLHFTPEDLRRLNRIELAVMGIPEDLSDQLIAHRWYSPRHTTVLVEALAALDLATGRAAFVEAAVSAESEHEARFYQRTAELLRVYSEQVERIERIAAVDGVVIGYTADGTEVVPLAADHALWNRRTAHLANALDDAPDAPRRELLLSGIVSPLARERLEARGVAITENGFETLRAQGSAAASEGSGDE